MTNKEVALKAAKVLSDKKAMDVVAIDISKQSSFADYFVIASANSDRQLGAFTDEVEDKLEAEGVIVKKIEGQKDSGWILMDYGDVIVNIFSIEQRDRYKIEKIWSDCEFLDVEE